MFPPPFPCPSPVAVACALVFVLSLRSHVDMCVSHLSRLAEQSGIVFIDEIDKIVSDKRKYSGDASAEGVQRDLLPLIEGCSVDVKRFGSVRTDYILFICSGAFSENKPADMLAELQVAARLFLTFLCVCRGTWDVAGRVMHCFVPLHALRVLNAMLLTTVWRRAAVRGAWGTGCTCLQHHAQSCACLALPSSLRGPGPPAHPCGAEGPRGQGPAPHPCGAQSVAD